MPDEDPQILMREALAEAQAAFAAGEIPVGAVLSCAGRVLAAAHNTRERDKDPLEHAEIKVLRLAAATRGDWRLSDCDLYVTLEPCPMCLGALFQARVRRLFFGCFDDKRLPENAPGDRNVFPSLKTRLSGAGTAELSSNNHALAVHGGVLSAECAGLLKDFFRARRASE